MAEISKQALKVDNNQSFPNNNNGAITPSILRAFNTNMIDSMVDEISYNVDSASWNQQIDALEQFTQSFATAFVSTASFNAYTQSINAYTASNNIKWNNAEVATASLFTSVTNLNTTTASLLVETQNLELFSASALTSLSNLNSATSSLFTSASLGLTTASLSGQTLTFSKGDGTTFGILIPDVSGSDISQLNAFTASQLIINTGYNATTASLLIETQNLELFSASTLTRLTNIETTTASLNSSVTQLNASSASQQISIDSINAASSSWITESETGSFARYDVSNPWSANQTFTNITATSASFTYVQTLYETASVIYSSGSNQFGDELSDTQTLSGSVKIQGSLTINGLDVTGSLNSLNASSASQQISINALNVFTASQSTASIVTSIDNLNTFSASALVSISNINNTTASLNTSVSNLNTFTSSANQRLSSLETNSASVNTSITNINTFTQSAEISINALNAATSSYVTSAITASSLVTASFDNGTRNLTFTKGDASTFNVNIPDVSGSAGDFATTGSNTFTGVQNFTADISASNTIINGDLIVNPTTKTSLNGNTDIGAFLYINSGLTLNTPAEITWTGVSGSIGSGFSASVDARINAITGSGGSIATGSFATTGSNSFIGNQIITGNVTISGSATSDLTVVGQIFVSSSATGGTTQPRIIVSGSSGQSTITRNNINVTNGTNSAGLAPSAIFASTSATDDQFGFSINPVAGGISGWTIGPVIYITDPSDNYPAVFGFQNKANYTDGRVAVLTPLSASAGFTASLQNGYTWVGNSLGQNTQVATSSFGTAINTGSFATTGSNIFTGNQRISGANTLQVGGTSNQVFINSSSIQLQNPSQTSINFDAPTNFFQTNGDFNLQNTISGVGSGSISIQASNGANLNISASQINSIAEVNVTGNQNINGNQSVVGVIQASDANYGPQFVSPTVFQGVGSASVAYDQFINGGNYDAIHIQSNLNAGTDFQDLPSDTFVLNTWLNIPTNTGNNPTPVFTRGLTIQSGSSFFANGNKQFNVGAFQSNVTQSGSANVSQSMNFETTDISEGVSIASNSRITLANSGTYNIQFSAQTQATGGADNLYIWLKKNGTNVTASAGNVEIQNNQEVIAAWNYVVDAVTSDYFELCWQAGNTGTILLAAAASGNIPSIPSIILTVTQVR
jgi:uncharacterized coiled-coil protein SlyX